MLHELIGNIFFKHAMVTLSADVLYIRTVMRSDVSKSIHVNT